MPAPVTAPSAPADPAAGSTPRQPSTAASAATADRGAASPDLERPTSDWLEEAGADFEVLSEEGSRQERGELRGGRQRQPDVEREEAARGETETETETEVETETETETDQEEAEREAEGGRREAPREVPAEQMTAPQLRKAHKALQQKVNKELQPKIQTLERENAELRARPAAESEEHKAKLTGMEKRLAEQEATIRFLDYQKSEDFKKNYQEPYVKAWNEALSDIAEMEVELNGGGTRRATEQDLIRLGNMPLQKARTEANAMFGDSADDIMHHVRQLRHLANQQQDALERAQTEAQKRAQEDSKNASTRAAERVQKWTDSNKAIATKYPAWFAKQETDPEGNAVLDRGFALANLVFSPHLVKPEMLPTSFANDIKANGGKLSPEMQIRLHALIRNKAAGFDRLAAQVKALRKELSEAKKVLDGYEASAPPGAGGTRGGTGTRGGGRRQAANGFTQDQANDEIDALDR